MKISILHIFFAIIISLSMLACTNQSSSEKDNISDTSELKNNTTGNILDKDLNEDQEFMMDAAYKGLLEVELGKYAQQNAQNLRVKNFATMMVKDHSKANDELNAIAVQKNITLPTTLDDKHMDMINDMKTKRGAEFDKEYMVNMVNDHKKDIDKFKRHAENGTDPDITTFAAKSLPILLMHQDSAQNIKDFLK